MDFNEKLKKAEQWFADMTDADPELIRFMGLSPHILVEMYEREHPE